jgi:hypothetical protein
LAEAETTASAVFLFESALIGFGSFLFCML